MKPLAIGDAIPAFLARDAEGRVWSEADLRGRVSVLYFYPKDETPGCIAEGCAYRDVWHDFQDIGVTILGVSRDSIESHRAFAEHRRLPFPLLADEDGAMHRAFGALLTLGLPRRISFLIGPDARVVDVYESHLRPEAHAERMLASARRTLAR